MPPRPRTSPTMGQRRCHSRARRWKRSPSSLARANKFSFLKQIEHGESGGAGKRIAGESSAEAAGSGRVHDFGAAGDGGKRQSTAQGFRSDENVGLDAVAFAGEERAGASEAGLHFIGDEENAVLVAEIDEHFEIVRRRSDESAFTQDRFGNDRGDFFIGDDALESIFEMARAVEIAGGIFQVVRAAITVGERDAVNLAGERRETGLIRMRLAGESERHHGAAVESVFEGDDARDAWCRRGRSSPHSRRLRRRC